MVELRDKKRYGLFKANSNKGIVKISISIYGWGELFKVIGADKDNKELEIIVDTSEDFSDDCDFYEETEEYIDLFDECGHAIKVYKPFIRCLKRYK
jgi:hypothetical protein